MLVVLSSTAAICSRLLTAMALVIQDCLWVWFCVRCQVLCNPHLSAVTSVPVIRPPSSPNTKFWCECTTQIDLRWVWMVVCLCQTWLVQRQQPCGTVVEKAVEDGWRNGPCESLLITSNHGNSCLSCQTTFVAFRWSTDMSTMDTPIETSIMVQAHTCSCLPAWTA